VSQYGTNRDLLASFFFNLCYPRKPKSRDRAIVAERQYQSYTNPGIAQINHLIQGALQLPFFLKSVT
jgi:hypothetical protein